MVFLQFLQSHFEYKLNRFKDYLFDLINESNLPIADIDTNDAQNTFTITTTDKSKFVLTMNKIEFTKIIYPDDK